jgi:hypothetical protein
VRRLELTYAEVERKLDRARDNLERATQTQERRK